MYMILMQLYPGKVYEYLWFTCFFLDFGSHFMQFCSTALMGAESHKGKNKYENKIVYLYYNVYAIFALIVFGSEAAAVLCLIYAKE